MSAKQPGYIHGSSDPAEVNRLERQAQWAAAWMLRDFDAPAGTRVLDLATGVGAMVVGKVPNPVGAHFPGIRLVGVDLSPTQLQWARKNHPDVPLARANAARLPFADATFERVHCSWLLEHVSGTVAVKILREVHRVLRDDGTLVLHADRMVRDSNSDLRMSFNTSLLPNGRFRLRIEPVEIAADQNLGRLRRQWLRVQRHGLGPAQHAHGALARKNVGRQGVDVARVDGPGIGRLRPDLRVPGRGLRPPDRTTSGGTLPRLSRR